MRIVFYARAAALAAISTLVVSHAGPLPVLGANWVVNGDAESGAGSTDGSVVPVPGWSTTGGSILMTAVQYQPSPGSFPAITDPGPPTRGNNFFAGGPNVALSTSVQTFDVSGLASQIDAGLLHYTLSGWLGGWQNQDDFARWDVQFLSATSVILGVNTLTGPNAAARGNQTGLLFETTNGAIPSGTRMLFFELDLDRLAGAYDDGYADNLSFVATSTGGSAAPEPGAIGLVLAGAAVVVARGRFLRSRLGANRT